MATLCCSCSPVDSACLWERFSFLISVLGVLSVSRDAGWLCWVVGISGMSYRWGLTLLWSTVKIGWHLRSAVANTVDLEPVSSGGNQRCCVRLPVETVMRTASTVQFPKSVFKAQGIIQVAYAHPRDVKTGGCLSDGYLLYQLVTSLHPMFLL